MGLLDDLLGGLAGQAGAGQSMGRPMEQPQARPGGGGMSNVMMALLPVVLAMLANRGGSNPQGGSGQRGGSPGGGGLADLVGAVLGGSASAAGTGGLGELLTRLQRAGLGTQAQSWVGPGQNLPITPEALEQVFGRSGLAEIARHVGVSEADATSALSQLLPEVVDRVTPEGKVPDLDSLAASVDDLSRRSRRA